jgi:L-rhamnose mutarotase
MSGVRRFGQLVRVRPESVEAYERLHAAPWPAVIAAIRRANIRNYSIYRYDGLLFGYYEYAGDDYQADMATMAADPEVKAWWALTDAMQEPFPERRAGSWWLDLPEIFHADSDAVGPEATPGLDPPGDRQA